MAEYKGVMVHCEVEEGKLAAIATELLGYGRKLADELKQPLSAALIGSDIGNLSKEAIAYGADKVYVVDNPLLKDYQTDTYVPAMEKVVEQAAPEILLLGQTATGRDLAPRLAFRLNTAATLDSVELAIDPDSKRLLQTKPVYGGNAQAIYTCDSNPQIASVRAKVAEALQPDSSKQGEVINVDAGIDESTVRTKVLEKVPEVVEGIKLEDAEVVICGGRGIGSTEGFEQLKELATAMGGAVGASRPPCDNGWIADSQQIGLTGKIIAPALYIAVAISGSSQHMSGCSGSKNIVAINKDPEANIFKVAHYGVVGDWKQILPAFATKAKELIAK